MIGGWTPEDCMKVLARLKIMQCRRSFWIEAIVLEDIQLEGPMLAFSCCARSENGAWHDTS